MSDWSAGYVSEIDYTFGYYNELNPLRIKIAFLNKGLVFPEIGTACELGFGQGLSTNINAAATVTEWWGTDFNPTQASCAQEFARTSGAKARLFDESFEDFFSRADLPEFDYIGLHGIWSWISDANRHSIVEFINRKLKVGGVLYISYNTLPGWAAFAPMRHLLSEHAEVIGAKGSGFVSRIDDALIFAEKLMSINPAYARANPLIGERVKKLTEQNRHYLAHEYFNRDWHPMHFATLGHWLEDAKVSFACSANYLEHVDTINLNPEQEKFLYDIQDPMFRESVRDFITNQQFRKDYWIKGPRKLSDLERTELIGEQRVVLVCPRKDVVLTVNGAIGEATMHAAVYEPILKVLEDNQVKTIAEIAKIVKQKEIQFAQVVQAVMILIGANFVNSAQSAEEAKKVKAQCDKINHAIMRKARTSADLSYLASPVIGGGIAVSRFHQLFILAIQSGLSTCEDWADYVWQILNLQGQRLLKEGKPLETREENIKQLVHLAKEFEAKNLPIFRALQIV